MADSSFIVKVGFNYLHRSTEESLFLNMTVWDYLWNYHSVLVSRAKDLVPFLVPIENTGILNIVSFHICFFVQNTTKKLILRFSAKTGVL